MTDLNIDKILIPFGVIPDHDFYAMNRHEKDLWAIVEDCINQLRK